MVANKSKGGDWNDLCEFGVTLCVGFVVNIHLEQVFNSEDFAVEPSSSVHLCWWNFLDLLEAELAFMLNYKVVGNLTSFPMATYKSNSELRRKSYGRIKVFEETGISWDLYIGSGPNCKGNFILLWPNFCQNFSPIGGQIRMQYFLDVFTLENLQSQNWRLRSQGMENHVLKPWVIRKPCPKTMSQNNGLSKTICQKPWA